MRERQEPDSPVTLFLSYAWEDEHWLRKLETHLRLLERQGLISTWYKRLILAGSNQAQEIEERLNSASIILLLISADFLASDYCYSVEMQRALEREKQKEAYVIPIFLRPADWHDAPFRNLPGLPRENKPVTSWSNQDEAFREIAEGIRVAARQARNAAGESLPPLKSFVEYTQQFCEISNPNGEQWIYRIVKGQNLVTIGRFCDDLSNDITLGPNNCACISRRHCLLLKRDGKWWLICKGRHYPLIRRKKALNEEEEVHTETKLADGDIIRVLGETSPEGDISWMIRFCDGATTQPASTAAFLRFDKQRRALYRVVQGGEQRIPLSDEERDLVGVLLEHPGSFYEHNELIRIIWKSDPSKTRIDLRCLGSRLRDKIEPPGTKERFLSIDPAWGYSLHIQPLDEEAGG